MIRFVKTDQREGGAFLHEVWSAGFLLGYLVKEGGAWAAVDTDFEHALLDDGFGSIAVAQEATRAALEPRSIPELRLPIPLHALARQLAELLDGWSYDHQGSHGPDGHPYWVAYLRHQESQAAIKLGVWDGCSRSHDVAQGQRLDVSAVWPTDGRTTYDFRPSHVRVELNPRSYEITVRADRGLAQIAREIEARLLPAYLELLPEAVARRDLFARQHDSAESTYRRLGGLLGEGSMFDRRNRRASGHGIDITVHAHDIVEAKIFRLDPDTAEALVRFLVKRQETEREETDGLQAQAAV